MQETFHTKVHRKLMTLCTLHVYRMVFFLACHTIDTEYAVSTIRMNLLHGWIADSSGGEKPIPKKCNFVFRFAEPMHFR